MRPLAGAQSHVAISRSRRCICWRRQDATPQAVTHTQGTATPNHRTRLCSGRDLVNMAKQRPNVIPIIEDARHPQKYRMLVPMVDVVFADVAQPDQVRGPA